MPTSCISNIIALTVLKLLIIFQGSVSLNLLKLPEPYGSAREITSYKLDNEQRRTQSLFKRGSVRGWWPIHGDKNSSRSKEDKKKKKKEKGKKKSSDEDRLKVRINQQLKEKR